MTLAAKGVESLFVPFAKDGENYDVTVWKDKIEAIDQGDAAALWLEKFLDDKRAAGCRLVRIKDDFTRRTDPFYASGFETGTIVVSCFTVQTLFFSCSLCRRISLPRDPTVINGLCEW